MIPTKTRPGTVLGVGGEVGISSDGFVLLCLFVQGSRERAAYRCKAAAGCELCSVFARSAWALGRQMAGSVFRDPTQNGWVILLVSQLPSGALFSPSQWTHFTLFPWCLSLVTSGGPKSVHCFFGWSLAK